MSVLDRFTEVVELVGYLVIRLVYFHIIWLMFSISGLGILGIFPATMTVAYATNLTLNGRSFSIKELFIYYKNNFIVSNALGFIATVVFIFILIDIRLSVHYTQSYIIYIFFLVILTLLYLVFSVMFPTYIRYDLPILGCYKQSLYLLLGKPLLILQLLVVNYITYRLYVPFPILLIGFGVTLPLYFTVWATNYSYFKIEKLRDRDEAEVSD